MDYGLTVTRLLSTAALLDLLRHARRRGLIGVGGQTGFCERRIFSCSTVSIVGLATGHSKSTCDTLY